MKKLTKIIGTLLTVVSMAACDFNYKEITLEESEAKETEIQNAYRESNDDQLTVTTKTRKTYSYDGRYFQSGKSIYKGVDEQTITRYEDLNKLLVYQKETKTHKIVSENSADNVNESETKETWVFYKDGSVYDALRYEFKKDGRTTVNATYSQTKEEKEKVLESLNSELHLKQSTVGRLPLASEIAMQLFEVTTYVRNTEALTLKFYTNGNKYNLKYLANYDHSFKYSDIDISKLTKEEVQSEVSERTKGKFNLTINNYNDWKFNSTLTDVIKDKNGHEWSNIKITSDSVHKKGCNVSYPDLKDFDKVLYA